MIFALTLVLWIVNCVAFVCLECAHKPTRLQKMWARFLLGCLIATLVLYGFTAFHFQQSGYATGVEAAKRSMKEGRPHQFKSNLTRGGCCIAGLFHTITTSPYDPFVIRRKAYLQGARDTLPPHIGDEAYAKQQLEQLGAVFTESPSHGLTTIWIESEQVNNSNIHWIGVFDRVDRIVLISPRITDESLNHLMHFRYLRRMFILDSRLSDEGIQRLEENYSRTMFFITRDDKILDYPYEKIITQRLEY